MGPEGFELTLIHNQLSVYLESTQESFSLHEAQYYVVLRLSMSIEAHNSENSLKLGKVGLGVGCRFLYPRQ